MGTQTQQTGPRSGAEWGRGETEAEQASVTMLPEGLTASRDRLTQAAQWKYHSRCRCNFKFSRSHTGKKKLKETGEIGVIF